MAKGNADAADVGQQLAERIKDSTGWDLKVSTGPATRNAIVLSEKKPKFALGAEGYVLEVSPDAVRITANYGAGLFYGMQTLLQLLPPEIFASAPPAETVAWTAPPCGSRTSPASTGGA